MTVKDALDYYGGLNDILIEYRTYSPVEENILVGYCRYLDGKLISEDGDSYSLDDVISECLLSYDYNDNPYLMVWYKSEWMT